MKSDRAISRMKPIHLARERNALRDPVSTQVGNGHRKKRVLRSNHGALGILHGSAHRGSGSAHGLGVTAHNGHGQNLVFLSNNGRRDGILGSNHGALGILHGSAHRGSGSAHGLGVTAHNGHGQNLVFLSNNSSANCTSSIEGEMHCCSNNSHLIFQERC